MALLRLLRAKWTTSLLPAPTTFASKTILVTGANTGLGFHAAQHFVSLSAARVILAVRSLPKGHAARQRIEAATGRKGVVEVMQVDMSRFASVREFARRVEKEVERLHVVVLNAGVMMNEYELSPEGWEQTLQVNTLSTALMGRLLLPKLAASRPGDGGDGELPHLVVVNSELHATVKREQLPPVSSSEKILQAVNRKADPWYGGRQYSMSKLLLMYITKELASLMTSENGQVNVIITSCCPGFCYSDLGRSFTSWGAKLATWVFNGIFAKSSEQGSRTFVSAAALGPEAHGGYWKDDILRK